MYAHCFYLSMLLLSCSMQLSSLFLPPRRSPSHLFPPPLVNTIPKARVLDSFHILFVTFFLFVMCDSFVYMTRNPNWIWHFRYCSCQFQKHFVFSHRFDFQPIEFVSSTRLKKKKNNRNMLHVPRYVVQFPNHFISVFSHFTPDECIFSPTIEKSLLYRQFHIYCHLSVVRIRQSIVCKSITRPFRDQPIHSTANFCTVPNTSNDKQNQSRIEAKSKQK